MMNSNKGMDPMLCSFTGDSIWNTRIITDIELPSGQLLPLTSCDPVSPVPDSMLSSPELNNSSFADLASLWSTERKRVTSVKTDEDEGFSDVGSSVLDAEDDDIIHGSISPPPDDICMEDSSDESVYSETNCSNFLISSEIEARRYVEDKFLQIAFVPKSSFSHKDKIVYILSLSNCKEYTVDQILNLDKKSSDSARICSKIVQDIPQRYRWECVHPEQIPCCYTIVADCKKTSSRDKPPRPMNAFMIWAQGARRLINELCPKMQNAAISEALGYCWRQKSDCFKKRFELEKVKLRRFHNYEFPEYKYKPKTKVQKAKEKEELSLSKAKLSKTATKRKRNCDITPKEPNGRKPKCGRPKKIKITPENDQVKLPNSMLNHYQHTVVEKPVKMPPTKPAIKDMLTLKILNDRRTKEMSAVDSHPRENVHQSLGQLSPIQVESPHTSSDIFDEMRELEAAHNNSNNNTASSHFMSSSSVYDTPANTPPVDMEDDTRMSPVSSTYKTTHTSHYVTKVTASCSNTPSTSTHQTAALSRPAKNNKCLLSPQASMPSLTAILSSRPHIPPRNSQASAPMVSPRLPLIQRDNRPKQQQQQQQQQHQQQQQQQQQQQSLSYTCGRSSAGRLSSTDVILSCVSEMLDFPESKDIKPGDFLNRDSNNNSYNFFDNNNNYSSNNSNSFRLWDGFPSDGSPGNSLSGLFNPKLSMCAPAKIFDFNDLDTLCPDLNVPLLSDDVMSSLMNTL